MDLKKQYEELMRSELKSLGCNKRFTYEQLAQRDRRDSAITSNIPDYELSLLSHLFYSVVHRLFAQKPRDVVKYQGFDEKGNSEGIASFERKIRRGDSLIPHLSKKVFEADQATNNDPLLNEWQIYHFHIPPEDGVKSFVTRTNDLLFAIVTDDKVIFLDILPHSNETGTYEPWVDISIIEKIEQYYPEMLELYYVGGGRKPLTAEQRKALRGRNGSTKIITSRGREYLAPGFGSVAAGLPTMSIRQGDAAQYVLRSFSGKPNVRLYFDCKYNLMADIGS